MVKRVAALAALVLGALAPIPAVVSAQQPPAAVVPHPGARVWAAAQCRFCHGPNGEGLSAKPLAGTLLSPDQFVQHVREGGPQMPRISARAMSDDNARLLQDYMVGLAAPASWTRIAAPVSPDASPGQRMFTEKNCISCHGPGGQIPMFPAGSRVSIADVVQQIRSPRAFMPTFRRDQVSDWEAMQIGDFIANVFYAQPGAARRTILPYPFAAFGLPQAPSHALDLPTFD